MLPMDKKKAATVIVSKMGGSGESPMKPEEEISGDDSALKAIAEDLIQALNDKSAHGVMEALSAFIVESELQN